MITITKSDYEKLHEDYRGVWATERWDIPGWEQEREKYMGKHTMLHNDNGATCLLIEGLGFEIIEN